MVFTPGNPLPMGSVMRRPWENIPFQSVLQCLLLTAAMRTMMLLKSLQPMPAPELLWSVRGIFRVWTAFGNSCHQSCSSALWANWPRTGSTCYAGVSLEGVATIWTQVRDLQEGRPGAPPPLPSGCHTTFAITHIPLDFFFIQIAHFRVSPQSRAELYQSLSLIVVCCGWAWC